MTIVAEEFGVRSRHGESARGLRFWSASVLTSDASCGAGGTSAVVVQVCAIEGRELWVGRSAPSVRGLPALPIALRSVGEPPDGATDVRYLVRAADSVAFDADDAHGATLRRLIADPVMRHLAASLAS